MAEARAERRRVRAAATGHSWPALATTDDFLVITHRLDMVTVNLAMNIRLFGPGTALLHSIPGNEDGVTCNIQITSFVNARWEPFKDRLMARWLSIPCARPHWAKQYQNLPGIAQTLRAVYGKHLATFLRIRDEEGIDPDKIFVNAFLDNLLFADPPATR